MAAGTGRAAADALIRRRAGRAALAPVACALVLTAALATPAQAALLQQHCAPAPTLSPRQQDRLLRFAAFITEQLQASGQPLALVARAGLDLRRFGLRYSHAGISLRESPNTPWSVRQLYYDCDTGRARLFDQGLAGFVLGADRPDAGWFSALLLPAPAAAALQAQALDAERAAQALHPLYSANAHAWSLRYQNCNQWLVETLALAWGAAPASAGDPPRAAAQAWLRAAGYQPQRVAVGNRLLMGLASALPWLHNDDHPAEDLEAGLYQVSLPGAIEAFVQTREPGAQRLEFCHDERQMVLRRGGPPMGPACEAAPGDEIRPF